MQQGRVQLDADWNEQMDINNHRIKTETKDLIGGCGAPIHEAGFNITSSGQALIIGAGKYYVNGILCENENSVSVLEQPDIPKNNPDKLLVILNNKDIQSFPPPVGKYLVYLDVWHRHITALEDKEIRETALGGPDTATRSKTVWQVKLYQIEAASGTDINCSSAMQSWNDLISQSDGKLSARAEASQSLTDVCIIAPGAGYRRLENQLYRIEVHKGGSIGSASFKWSRDNGSIVVSWLDQDADNLIVSSLGRDKYLGFSSGQLIELFDDSNDLYNKPGTLVKIIKAADNVITIDPLGQTIDITNFKDNPRIRRWDCDNELSIQVPSENDGWLKIEDGVEIKFSNSGNFRTGDYWLIPARTSTADVEWQKDDSNNPVMELPKGIKHNFCRLAIADFWENNWTITDCRKLFPPLTELPNLKCFNFLDELRADGVVRNADNEIGFVVDQDPNNKLSVTYTEGIAYVAGCRYQIPAGKINVDLSTTHQTLLINSKGQVELITKGDLPDKYAAIAIISTYEKEIKQIVDARFDLTHLDIKVKQNRRRVAEKKVDRRQFVPLLAYSIKGLEYRDGRNIAFPIVGAPPFRDGLPYGLTSDGDNIWVCNFSGTEIAKIPRFAEDINEVEYIALSNDIEASSWGVAYDGCCLWFTLYQLNSVICLNPQNMKTNVIKVGKQPTGIAFDGDFIWVCNTASNSISIIDVETRQIIRTVELKFNPWHLAFDGTYMWIAVENLLYKIEKPWGDLQTISELSFNRGYLVFDGTHIWASSRSGPIVKVNVTTNQKEIILDNIQSTNAITFDGTYIWAVEKSNNLYKIDPQSNQPLLWKTTLEDSPNYAIFDGTHLWLSGVKSILKRLV